MAEGEVIQLAKSSDVNLSETDYLRIIEKKTSHLIAAACAVGAIWDRHSRHRSIR